MEFRAVIVEHGVTPLSSSAQIEEDRETKQ
jgi:hypothetical protein